MFEVEILNVGDFKSIFVGDMLVVVMCVEDGMLFVWVNCCVYCGV